MRKIISLSLMVLALAVPASAMAQGRVTPSPSPTPTATVAPTPEPPRVDIPRLEKLLKDQKLGPVWPVNPIKYAIRGAVVAKVPANTIVLLLLLPFIALVIAFSRNVIGIRGFGIFLPAALSVTFVATGPVVGIGLFLVIVAVSTVIRMSLRKLKIKLQYLPRMAFILWGVVVGVLGVLFAAPILNSSQLSNVSIFAVLILILLAEDFIRVQLGKSVRTALNLTLETLILAVISYFFLTLKPLQDFALLNPEVSLLAVGIFDIVLARYSGMRLMEVFRFRKLVKS